MWGRAILNLLRHKPVAKKPTLVGAKAGLALLGTGMDAATFFNGLALAGVMHKRSYLSTTGSGEEKYFWIITDGWLHCGANKKTLHEFRTDPVFVPDHIPALLVLACEALLAHALTHVTAKD
jgi:hypothetical protein